MDKGEQNDLIRRLRRAEWRGRLRAYALIALGRRDEATRIYEAITQVSSDPEFIGQLAALYRESGRTAEANTLRARATARYDELLARYPEAMACHAIASGSPACASVVPARHAYSHCASVGSV